MKLFFDMKKRKPWVVIALLVVFVLVVGSGTVFAADMVAKSRSIGEENAKKFAFLDAGVDTDEVVFSNVELEREGLSYVYDVSFKTEYEKFEYEVRASDGGILEKEKEVLAERTETINEINAEPSSYISVDEAKSIALKKAGLSGKKVSFTKAKLEREDGKAVYDIEFYSNDLEYEYEINAYTGEIEESSIEDAVDGEPEQSINEDTKGTSTETTDAPQQNRSGSQKNSVNEEVSAPASSTKVDGSKQNSALVSNAKDENEKQNTVNEGNHYDDDDDDRDDDD